MPTTLTPPALKELEEILKTSRRNLSDIYRENRFSATVEEIAIAKAKSVKEIKDSLSALRVLFGHKPLPKQGHGRQQALNEAHSILTSPQNISQELEDHLGNLLVKGEKTNRRQAPYASPRAPQQRPKASKFTEESGIYVVTQSSYLRLAEATGEPLLVKIGWSHSIHERIGNFQTWDPEPVQTLRIFPCKDPNFVEAKIHICLDTLGFNHTAGGGREWFTAPLELIDAIASSLGLVNVKQA